MAPANLGVTARSSRQRFTMQFQTRAFRTLEVHGSSSGRPPNRVGAPGFRSYSPAFMCHRLPGPHFARRRQFGVSLAVTPLAAALFAAPAAAQVALDPGHPIPVDKGLPAEWWEALTARGSPTVLRGWDELRYVGMPVGGIGCGTVYLGGDGRLWCFDIFNARHEGVVPNILEDAALTDPFGGRVRERDGANFVRPPEQTSPWDIELRFALTVDDAAPRPLDRSGWRDVEFEWRWPIGIVRYSDPAVPVRVTLEAFAPLIPLDTARATQPATILRYSVAATDGKRHAVAIGATMRHPVLRGAGGLGGFERNVVPVDGLSDPAVGVLWNAHLLETPNQSRPDHAIADFESEQWPAGWTAEGDCFARGPFPWAERASYHDVRGHGDARYLTSHDTRGGGSCAEVDDLTGTLLSAPITLDRPFLNLKVAGGARPDAVYLAVAVDGQEVARIAGHSGNDLRPATLDLRAWEGKQAQFRFVDAAKGGWGNLTLDDLVLSDRPAALAALEQRPDWGSMALVATSGRGQLANRSGHAAREEATLSVTGNAAAVTAEFPFVLAWHFPNVADSVVAIPGIAPADRVRAYADRFADAGAVARAVAADLDETTRRVRAWCADWYDGTLPRWLLERTIAPATTLQTSTFHLFRGGHAWAWEGIGACEGTCTHVWHYAQSAAFLFPDLERDLRERTDFGIAFRADGMVDHRGGLGGGEAIDGQAGIVLRTWREHRQSADDRFLRRNWPRCRQAMEWLIGVDARDGAEDGLLAGSQPNTLDAAWFGAIPALCSLHLAALQAAAAMADEIGESGDAEAAAFAARCRAIAQRGRATFATLFDRERGWFVQREDPAHLDAIGTGLGCHIDQLLGDGWARVAALDPIVEPTLARTALMSLFDRNFAPDMGAVRASLSQPQLRGRPYALAGHKGLVMCTWPFGGRRSDWERHWQFGYFQECMTGFEHFAAATMIAQRDAELLRRGLAVERAIHERYAARERNPFNEVECSDHYARAMASHAVFLAVCGFDYHGPRGHLAFAPQIRPEAFRAAFTAAEGFGTLDQRRNSNQQVATIRVSDGRLVLRTIGLEVAPGMRARSASVALAGRSAERGLAATSARFVQDGARVTVALPRPLTPEREEQLEVRLELEAGTEGKGGGR